MHDRIRDYFHIQNAIEEKFIEICMQYIMNLSKYSSRASVSILSSHLCCMYSETIFYPVPCFSWSMKLPSPATIFQFLLGFQPDLKYVSLTSTMYLQVKLNQILTLIGNFPLVNQDRKQVIAMKMLLKVFSYLSPIFLVSGASYEASYEASFESVFTDQFLCSSLNY